MIKQSVYKFDTETKKKIAEDFYNIPKKQRKEKI